MLEDSVLELVENLIMFIRGEPEKCRYGRVIFSDLVDINWCFGCSSQIMKR